MRIFFTTIRWIYFAGWNEIDSYKQRWENRNILQEWSVLESEEKLHKTESDFSENYVDKEADDFNAFLNILIHFVCLFLSYPVFWDVEIDEKVDQEKYIKDDFYYNYAWVSLVVHHAFFWPAVSIDGMCNHVHKGYHRVKHLQEITYASHRKIPFITGENA